MEKKSMKIMSFDVGIKNMAYCIFDVSNNSSFSVLDWNVLNLMDIEVPNQTCSCVLQTKKPSNKPPKKTPKKSSKKTNDTNNISITPPPPLLSPSPQPETICNKPAKYQKNTEFFCEKHARQSSQYIIPKREFLCTQLKKKKIEELIILGNSYNIFQEFENLDTFSKKKVVEIIDLFFKNKCFELIIPKKTKTAGETDLIQIGRNMKGLLNEIPHIKELTHVIIENQISPIATRMKTIQGMLAQYFIMQDAGGPKEPSITIDFISSSNKLKIFKEIGEPGTKNIEKTMKNELLEKSEKQENSVNKMDKNKYKSNKKNAIIYCSRILEENKELEKWKYVMNTAKKDDLADCFLQGLVYLRDRTNNTLVI